MDTLKGLTETNAVFQRQLDDKDREITRRIEVKGKEIEQIKQELAKYKDSLSSIQSLVFAEANPEAENGMKRGEDFLELWAVLSKLQSQNLEAQWNRKGRKNVPYIDVVEALTKELKRLIKPYEDLK